MLLYGLQWWMISLPVIIIIGSVVAHMESTDIGQQTLYMQKLFALIGIGGIVQIVWGHKLPLVLGPSSILLVGTTISHMQGLSAVYTAIAIGGGALFFISVSGLLIHVRALFTPRIVAVILILITFSLTPTILTLLLGSKNHLTFHILFGLGVTLSLFLCNKVLPGILKSLTIMIGIIGGSGFYFYYIGTPTLPEFTPAPFTLFLPKIEFNPGVILSFIFCFVALAINEIGAIESVGAMLKTDKINVRIQRGCTFQGILNMAAGGMGVIGPVDFSLSSGVIAATGCASRFPLILAGIALVVCAFSSKTIAFLCMIPTPVMGAMLCYVMTSQLATGLFMLVQEKAIVTFNNGLTIALPLMVGLLIGFAPGEAFAQISPLLRPIVGNSFVMGTLTALLLEHVLFKDTAQYS